MSERRTTEMTPRPALLDVVKVDGSWAQVHSAGNLIRYLKSGDVSEIDWQEYRLTKFKITSNRIW